METYITLSSTNIFETINPFWAAIDKGWISPSLCHIFHVPEHKKEFQKIDKWFHEICKEYESIKNISIESQLFDDEDIPVFINIVKDLIRKESKRGQKIIIDVTSAEWNYIPASLMLIAEGNRKIIKSVLYQQFSNTDYAHTPYPLIPLTEQKLYNLINLEDLEDLDL